MLQVWQVRDRPTMAKDRKPIWLVKDGARQRWSPRQPVGLVGGVQQEVTGSPDDGTDMYIEASCGGREYTEAQAGGQP